MNFNENGWRYLLDKISIVRYPTLFWDSEHTHWHFTVGSRYVFDDNASLERGYVLISVFYVSMSFVFSLNVAAGLSIGILPNTLVNLYCNIPIYHGRHWVGMSPKFDSQYLSRASVSFKINKIIPH